MTAGAAGARPAADCVADAAGNLALGLPAGAGSGPGGHVLLRLRGAPEPGREWRLPAAPAGPGRLGAVLPGDAPLAEGRWDAYACAEGAAPVPLLSGVNDLRALLGRTPGRGRLPTAVHVPYQNAARRLTVRSWLRPLHAEAGELLVGERGLTVHGTLHGAPLTGRALLELAARRPGRAVLRAECETEGERFCCTVGHGLREAEPGVFDVWLRPDGARGPRVRVARLFDDVADKKAVYVYPEAALPGPAGRMYAGPYYTLDNDLAIRVRAAAPG